MVENALWHRVSEQEKEDIKKDSKKIMDDFAKKLEKIKVEEAHFSVGDGMRDESSGWETDEDFRSIAFCNAPDVDGDFFVAEKGGWK